MKYPFVKQTGIKDCGPACLLMITKYYKGSINFEKLKMMCKTQTNGTTAYDLIKASEQLGFKGTGYKINIDTLFKEKIKLPCIAHTIQKSTYLHYVVIYNIENNTITIADPYKGIKKLTKEQFNNIFNNIIIVLKPITKIKYENDYQELKKIISNIFKLNKKHFLKIWIMTLLLTILSILIFITTKISLDNINNVDTLKKIFLSSIILILLNWKTSKIINKENIIVSSNIDNYLMTKVYKSLLNLPYQFYCSNQTGEIIKRVNDLKQSKNTLIYFINNILLQLPLFISSLTLMFLINKTLTIIIIISLIINYLIIIKANENENIEEALIQEENINHYLYTTIKNINYIKGISIEEKIYKRFKENYQSLMKKITNITYKLSNIKELLNLINALTNGIIIFYGCILINQNKISLTSFIFLITIKEIAYIPITNFQNIHTQIKNSLISIRRIMEIFSITCPINIIDRKIGNTIQINYIKYQYNNKTINYSCNLTIKKGEKIFLTGPSGSGKTTILNQIYKNIKTPNNSIQIDNTDINKIEKSVIKNNIAYIYTNDLIISDTLNNNLLIKNEQEIKDIKKICCLENIKSEDNALALSEGEKQRIIIARALTEKKEIYLFDETFNKIDSDTERKMLKNIFRKYNNKTFIIVSHKKDNIDLFDKVVTLKNNKAEILCRRG